MVAKAPAAGDVVPVEVKTFTLRAPSSPLLDAAPEVYEAIRKLYEADLRKRAELIAIRGTQRCSHDD